MAARVRALCDRRAGIGGDGVLRVVREGDGWFMDYRNADGSISEMCGNGIRVFVRHLVEEGLVDPAGPIDIATRDGIKTLLLEGDQMTVDLGVAQVLPETKVIDRGDRAGPPSTSTWATRTRSRSSTTRPTLAALDLTRPPEHDEGVYPARRQRRARRPAR